MADLLKPCPFCGGKAFLIKGSVHMNALVGCDAEDESCALNGAPIYRDTTKAAIAAWNRRASDA